MSSISVSIHDQSINIQYTYYTRRELCFRIICKKSLTERCEKKKLNNYKWPQEIWIRFSQHYIIISASQSSAYFYCFSFFCECIQLCEKSGEIPSYYPLMYYPTAFFILQTFAYSFFFLVLKNRCQT